MRSRVICISGIIFRWGAVIPATLLAFFFGRFLPEKHGYLHNLMEAVEHEWIDPTMLAAAVAVLLIVFDLTSVRKHKPSTNGDVPHGCC
jgi:hypothetical protein